MKKKSLKMLSLALMCSCLGALPAAAETFFWQDPVSGLSLEFPDTWRVIANQNAGDVLTLRGPDSQGAMDFATCRVNVREEGRFKMFEAAYKPHFDADYWNEAFAVYDVKNFSASPDGGRVSAIYDTTKGAKMTKRALATAQYYNNRVYMVECAAEESAQARWQSAFSDLLDSVEIKYLPSDATGGLYRDFTRDKILKIRGRTAAEATYH